MEEFVIQGGNAISGIINPQGNKNEALPILCCALASDKEITISNVPDIEDIRNVFSIITKIGGEVERLEGDNYRLLTTKINNSILSPELTSSIRGSVTLLAPLLARVGEVYLPKPGGDKIGRRRIDTHLHALSALGSEVRVTRAGYHLEAKQLRGANILLDETSVTGTENAIMAASVAKGVTIIENAASEPHVQGVCNFMQAQGVAIEGVGSNVLKIRGVENISNLTSASHEIGPDYLEIGSFLSMAALTGGKLRISNVRPYDLRMIKMIYSRLGIEFTYQETGGKVDLLLEENQQLEIHSDFHGEIPKIDDAPWPAFPADMISLALVTATQCKGTVLIHEKLFESRLFFTDKLISMGAKIVLCDPHRAVIIGPSKLHGASMSSPDIRAGMALIIAALAAEGESRIKNILQVDRGYSNIDKRLQAIGAQIERRKVS